MKRKTTNFIPLIKRALMASVLLPPLVAVTTVKPITPKSRLILDPNPRTAEFHVRPVLTSPF